MPKYITSYYQACVHTHILGDDVKTTLSIAVPRDTNRWKKHCPHVHTQRETTFLHAGVEVGETINPPPQPLSKK